MKIAIASLGDPRAISTWSGIPAHIAFALESIGHEIIAIKLFFPREPWYYSWIRRIYYRVQKRWFLASVEKRMLKLIGKQIDEQVSEIEPDVVIIIHGDLLAHATFKQPACTIHDATFATLLNYYSDFTNLAGRSIKAGNSMYQKAMDRTNAAVFSAAWASNSAINDYKADPGKVYTIPLGANLNKVPLSQQVNNWIDERSCGNICKFLFLGVSWERKGGPDALSFVKALNKNGTNSKLVVVGCKADILPGDEPFVEQIGFLRKNVHSENQRLENLFVNCQALLVPSTAECYGCVYCEANAYGLPALGRDTGGVSEIIKDGINGLLLKASETPQSFADRWSSVWKQREKYKTMSENSRKEYNDRLNYITFAGEIEKVLLNLVDNDHKRMKHNQV